MARGSPGMRASRASQSWPGVPSMAQQRRKHRERASMAVRPRRAYLRARARPLRVEQSAGGAEGGAVGFKPADGAEHGRLARPDRAEVAPARGDGSGGDKVRMASTPTPAELHC